jgi:hypothetical protein
MVYLKSGREAAPLFSIQKALYNFWGMTSRKEEKEFIRYLAVQLPASQEARENGKGKVNSFFRNCGRGSRTALTI